MIYKRFGINPHIKLYNNELERLFKFKILPSKVTKTDSKDALQEKNVTSIDELDQGHLKDILNLKILLPIQKVIENQESKTNSSIPNPVH